MSIEQKNTKNGDIEGTESKIFVMPEKFLGVLPGEKTPDEALKKADKIFVPQAQPVPKKIPPIVKKKKFPMIPVIGGGILLVIIISTLVYFFVLPKPKQIAQVVIPTKENIPKSPSIPKEEATSTIFVERESVTSTPMVKEEGVPMGLDSDGDGLTDVEEEVFGSVVSNPDTDQDSFLDGHEVFHLYNPAGITPEKLIDTGAVKNYKNDAEKYQIYYPLKWNIDKLGSEAGGGMKINSNTGEFIAIIVEKNQNNLPIISWYLEQAPGVKAGDIQTFVTKSNLDGIKSPDGFSAYFTRNGIVYIISYNIGIKPEINYKRTFEMMLNSFRIDR